MELRKTGIDLIGDVNWGTHFCQFYQTKQDLLDILIPYFKSGLENNEFCMWVASEPLNSFEINKEIEKYIPGIKKYIDSGQLEILEYSDWYVKGGVFDSQRVLNGWVSKLNQALAKGFEGLRLTGNTFWLEKKHWKDFANYEKEVNDIIGKYKMLAICTYSLDKCNSSEIIDVVINHQFALIKRENKWDKIINFDVLKAKEAMYESEERYRSLFDNMLDGFAFCRLIYENGKPNDFIYLNINKAFENLTGLKNVVGRRVSEVIPGILKSDPEIFNIYGRVAESGKPERFETYLEALGIWLLISVYSPEKGHFVATFDNVTSRKQAEDSMRKNQIILNKAQEMAHLGSWELDLKTNHLSWSDEVYRIFGLKPQEFGASYDAFLGFVHPDDRSKVDTAYTDSVREGKNSYDIEHRIVRKLKGEVRIVHEKCEHFFDKSGKISRSVGMVHDITEQKHNEEELKKANEELKRVDQLKSDFVSMVSHELRTPLALVKESISLVTDGVAGQVNNEQNKLLSSSINNVDRLARILNDILDLSRIESGKLETKKNHVDISALVKNISDKWLPEARKKEIKYSVIVSNKIIDIFVDPGRTEQVLGNLISNAIKYTPGKGEIKIELKESQDSIIISVSDSGIGISENDLPKVFDKFQRFGEATGVFAPGTGLGLAITKKLVELQKGTITVESKLGLGSKFSFTLPKF